ncbi:MAG: D-arabinose 5-phosphate isomerase [Acidobacteria bacterium]|nr:MAG: D-arabinose 5-phosphate isomerase [Acidobacteriota bacterium]PYQ67270.1 MAG: D-arabinose 5-phosphate isomerase [Acidobacteriota bacterium]
MILEAARKVLQIEADSVREQIRNLGPDFENAVEEISASTGRLCVTGLGKSGLIGQKIAATLSSTGTPAYFLHAAEASHGDLGMLVQGDTVLALSFSGETPEVVRLLEFARERKVRAIAMTGQPASSVGRAADRVISVAISQEACPLNLAPTASTTAMLAMGDALAMAISEKRGFREEDFAALHPGGRLGRKFLKVKDLMRTADRIPLVTRETPMTEAIHEMSRKMMGITAVVNGRGELAGVISDGDLRRLLENDRSLLARTAGECSHARPKTISAEDLASEALQRMQQAKITSLFVVDDAGSLAGAIHMHDLLAAGIA